MTTGEAASWVPELLEHTGIPDGYDGILEARFESLDELNLIGDAKLYWRTGLSTDELERLYTWAVERLGRLAEHHDPRIDDWGIFPLDGHLVLQLHARTFWLPDMGFLDGP